MVDQELLKRVFRAFDPEEVLRPEHPASPRDPRYVECDVERGSSGLLNVLVQTIRLSPYSTCQLLSGQPGGGKSTELARLQQQLRSESPAYWVVNLDAVRDLDRHDLEAEDLLLAILGQLWQEAGKIGPRIWYQSLFQGLGQELALGKITGDPAWAEGPGGVAGWNPVLILKRDRRTRHLLREHLRQRSAAFLEAARDVTQQIVSAVQKELPPVEGVVVIVDNLDQMPRNRVSGSERTSHEVLFLRAATLFRHLACHVVCTAPPALLSGPAGSRLGSLFGNPPRVLPQIPVRTRDEKADLGASEKLVEIVAERLAVADLSLVDAFASRSSVERLAEASGGSPRSLIDLARRALLQVRALPIPAAAVERTVRDSRDLLILSVGGPQRWQLLRQVGRTKELGSDESALELLDSGLVLEYRDAEGPWFDVHPLLKEARAYGT